MTFIRSTRDVLPFQWRHATTPPPPPGVVKNSDVPFSSPALAKVNYRWYVNPFVHGEPEPDAMSAALEKSREYLLEREERMGG